jgi:hypothetical protein
LNGFANTYFNRVIKLSLVTNEMIIALYLPESPSPAQNFIRLLRRKRFPGMKVTAEAIAAWHPFFPGLSPECIRDLLI